MSSFYVYGFTHADAAPCPAETGEPEVFLHASGPVAAVVTEIGEARPDPTEHVRSLLLNHHRVLARMVEQETVIIPLQSGLVLPSKQDLCDLVARERSRIELLLAVFAGRIEANVKAYYDEKAILQEILDANPHLRHVGTGYFERIRSGEQIANLLDRTRRSDADSLVAAVRQDTEQVAVHPATHYTAFNMSFLVKNDALPEFEAALTEWNEPQRTRLRMKLVAPLPPYSFVNI